mmetsp:Transcript_121841/g.356082  ORF Transcript_121841/g.356082 Transcript_121841/m.356082 type:complete len:418 (+) Transcript_121841:301-1554(+)
MNREQVLYLVHEEVLLLDGRVPLLHEPLPIPCNQVSLLLGVSKSLAELPLRLPGLLQLSFEPLPLILAEVEMHLRLCLVAVGCPKILRHRQDLALQLALLKLSFFDLAGQAVHLLLHGRMLLQKSGLVALHGIYPRRHLSVLCGKLVLQAPYLLFQRGHLVSKGRVGGIRFGQLLCKLRRSVLHKVALLKERSLLVDHRSHRPFEFFHPFPAVGHLNFQVCHVVHSCVKQFFKLGLPGLSYLQFFAKISLTLKRRDRLLCQFGNLSLNQGLLLSEQSLDLLRRPQLLLEARHPCLRRSSLLLELDPLLLRQRDTLLKLSLPALHGLDLLYEQGPLLAGADDLLRETLDLPLHELTPPQELCLFPLHREDPLLHGPGVIRCLHRRRLRLLPLPGQVATQAVHLRLQLQLRHLQLVACV